MPRRRLALGIARGRIRPRVRAAITPTVIPPAPHSNAQTIGTLVTAFTAIGALIFTALSLNATRDQVAAAQRQNEVAQQGQYTDRYTKAVEQLDQAGPEHLQTRLGGIYALQRLTQDSPRDQPTIVNVLVTFVTSTIQRSAPADSSTCPDRIAPDIQAALTVLTERDRHHDGNAIPDLGMRLAGACLANSSLAAAFLMGADLRGADLSSADLRKARLGTADMGGADLNGANLSEAGLRGANLNWAALGGADLRSADLSGANLIDAQAPGAKVDGAVTDSTTMGKWW